MDGAHGPTKEHIMFAIVGTVGSIHHTYKHFPSTRSTWREVKEAAAGWADGTAMDIAEAHPALGSIYSGTISERDAQTVRYLDGRRVYTVEGSDVIERRDSEAAIDEDDPSPWTDGYAHGL